MRHLLLLHIALFLLHLRLMEHIIGHTLMMFNKMFIQIQDHFLITSINYVNRINTRRHFHLEV